MTRRVCVFLDSVFAAAMQKHGPILDWTLWRKLSAGGRYHRVIVCPGDTKVNMNEQCCGNCRWFERDKPDDTEGWCWWPQPPSPYWVSYIHLENTTNADDGEWCDTWEEPEE